MASNGTDTTSKDDLAKVMKEDTTFVSESVAVMKSMDGKEKKGDLIVAGLAEALVQLTELVEGKAAEGNPKCDWTFEASPLSLLNKSLPDFYRSYLIWSQKAPDKEVGTYNVSKALRRLEVMAKFCVDFKDIVSTIDLEEAETLYRGFGCLCPKEKDSEGRLIWFIDLGKIDTAAVKGNQNGVIRMFWYFIHKLMLDPEVEENGLVIVEDIGGMGLMTLMGLMDSKTQKALDKLTLGATSIKMKKCYILSPPWWCTALMKLMSLFMSKKMRSRIELIHGKYPANYATTLLGKLGNPYCLPSLYEGFTGDCVDKYWGTPMLVTEDLEEGKAEAKEGE